MPLFIATLSHSCETNRQGRKNYEHCLVVEKHWPSKFLQYWMALGSNNRQKQPQPENVKHSTHLRAKHNRRCILKILNCHADIHLSKAMAQQYRTHHASYAWPNAPQMTKKTFCNRSAWVVYTVKGIVEGLCKCLKCSRISHTHSCLVSVDICVLRPPSPCAGAMPSAFCCFSSIPGTMFCCAYTAVTYVSSFGNFLFCPWRYHILPRQARGKPMQHLAKAPQTDLENWINCK